MSTRQLHKYVWGWVGLFTAIAATFPIAMMRVSQMKRFAGQPLDSQTCESHPQKGDRQVVSWLETCRYLTVKPLKSAVK